MVFGKSLISEVLSRIANSSKIFFYAHYERPTIFGLPTGLSIKASYVATVVRLAKAIKNHTELHAIGIASYMEFLIRITDYNYNYN